MFCSLKLFFFILKDNLQNLYTNFPETFFNTRLINIYHATDKEKDEEPKNWRAFYYI